MPITYWFDCDLTKSICSNQYAFNGLEISGWPNQSNTSCLIVDESALLIFGESANNDTRPSIRKIYRWTNSQLKCNLDTLVGIFSKDFASFECNSSMRKKLMFRNDIWHFSSSRQPVVLTVVFLAIFFFVGGILINRFEYQSNDVCVSEANVHFLRKVH